MPAAPVAGAKSIPNAAIDTLTVETINQTGDFTVTGDLILTADAAAAVPLTIKMHASQSAAPVKVQTGSDANAKFQIAASGDKIEFGAGGASAVDTNLYRAAANTLKTDDEFFHAANVTLLDGVNVVVGATTGTKIATTTTDKLGFWNQTPVARPSAFTQTYSTADKTHANPTATALTAASGTADGTVDDVGASFNQTTLNNNFQECATRINQLITDLADTKQLCNSIIDDLQSMGLFA